MGRQLSMNFGTFSATILPYWQSNLPTSLSDAADKLSTSYHLANIAQTTTFFAAPLVNADKSILKTFLELGMSINFYGGQAKSIISTLIALIKTSVGKSSTIVNTNNKLAVNILSSLISNLPIPLKFLGSILTTLVNSIFNDLKLNSSYTTSVYENIKKLEGISSSLDVSDIAYLVMSTGICLYWISAIMSPVPPMPPCIAPTGGTIILFPGTPIPLNLDLKNTFKNTLSSIESVSKFFNSCVLHQLTIGGVYVGIIPFFPSPIQGPPLPWFSLLNIPMPDFKLPKLLDEDGDGKKDPDKSNTGKNRKGLSTSSTSTSQNKNTQTGILGNASSSTSSTGSSTGSTSSSGTGGITGGNIGNISTQGNSGQSSSNQTKSSGSTGTQQVGSSGNVSIKLDNRYKTSGVIFDFFKTQTDEVFNSSTNKFKLNLDYNRLSNSYLQLVVHLAEKVTQLNTGENEFQFEIHVMLNNTAQNLQLGNSNLNLPTNVGEKINYTFRDTLESDNSIYSKLIISPKLRALELMKIPYKSALSSVLDYQLSKYVDKWYNGKFPTELLNVNYYITTEISDDATNMYGPFNKFNSLK